MEDSRALAIDEALTEPMQEAAAMAHAGRPRLRLRCRPGIRRVRRGQALRLRSVPTSEPVDGCGHARRGSQASRSRRPTRTSGSAPTRWATSRRRVATSRRRKQYRYHPDWRLLRDSAKFQRMIEFGDALPRLRRRVRRDLAREGLPREKVLAAIVQPARRDVDSRRQRRIRAGQRQLRADHATQSPRPLPALGSARCSSFAPRAAPARGRRRRQAARAHRAAMSPAAGQRLFQYLDEGSRARRRLGPGEPVPQGRRRAPRSPRRTFARGARRCRRSRSWRARRCRNR